MKKLDLAIILMNARLQLAEGTLTFLARKLSELADASSAGQIALLRDRIAQAMEDIAQGVEADFLKPRAGQKIHEEERKLLADEFRLLLDEMKAKFSV